MLGEMTRLWRGQLSFIRAFWVYAVAYGVPINLVFGGLALLAFSMTGSAALLLVLHFLPLPYNILACAGAWRAANQWTGPDWRSNTAKLAIIALFIALLVA
jgi:hypothetical protein